MDPETERAIETKAARAGLTPGEYVARLAQRSARAKRPGVPKKPAPSDSDLLSPEERIQGIIDRADPAELAAEGITLSKYRPKTGADLLRNLKEAGLIRGFGDPNIDSPELARQLREQAQTRDWD